MRVKPLAHYLPAGGPNAKGGIAANAKREVLDWAMKPIPRLYTAGEISSALKFVYQGGGNLTECIVFAEQLLKPGRINVAAGDHDHERSSSDDCGNIDPGARNNHSAANGCWGR